VAFTRQTYNPKALISAIDPHLARLRGALKNTMITEIDHQAHLAAKHQ
jgi:hypothetical protein